MACHNYQAVYGVFPPAYIADEQGRPLHSWRVLILPFIEQKELYEQYDLSQPWNSPHNRQLIPRIPRTLVFPGDERSPDGVTNYLAVVGPETVWPGDESTSSSVISNPSATIMIVENEGSGIRWTEPRDLSLAEMNLALSDNPTDGISSKFSSPAVACADGRLRTIDKGLPVHVVRAMLTVDASDDVEDARVVELPNGRDMDQQR